MKSSLFYSKRQAEIEKKLKNFLNSQPDYLSPKTAGSPRATGDAIQELLAENFAKILGDSCKDYSSDFARRAMADLAFKDGDDFYYIVDVKTHRKEEGFHMPNLTSVERLSRFYEDDKNYFLILFIGYAIQKSKVMIEDLYFIPIEFLSWKCLTIGALGWGQIQIANSNNLTIEKGMSRKSWMLKLCDTLAEFYPKEISKITKRITHFEKIRKFWENKAEE
jgi:hypothetical protein